MGREKALAVVLLVSTLAFLVGLLWTVGDPLECLDPPPSKPLAFLNDTSTTVRITNPGDPVGVVVRPGATQQLPNYLTTDEVFRVTNVATGRTAGCFHPAVRHCASTTTSFLVSHAIAC
jgi:hypothetical protein